MGIGVVPDDPVQQAGLLHSLVGAMGERLCALADGRGVSNTCEGRNFGSEIRGKLEALRSALLRSDPFENREVWPDEEILGAMRRARGNQMACGVSPVEILEYALCHSEKDPLGGARDMAISATSDCAEILLSASDTLLRQPVHGRFLGTV